MVNAVSHARYNAPAFLCEMAKAKSPICAVQNAVYAAWQDMQVLAFGFKGHCAARAVNAHPTREDIGCAVPLRTRVTDRAGTPAAQVINDTRALSDTLWMTRSISAYYATGYTLS